MRAMTGEAEGGRIVARATVALPGLGVGQEATVDPANPYIARCLTESYLVPVGPGPADKEPDQDAAGDAAA